MSVSIPILKSHGISAGEYKKIFSQSDKPKRVQKLCDLITERLKDGFLQNLNNWRTYAAIDLAFEVPFSQTTATFVEHLLSKRLTAEETMKELANYGLRDDDLFIKVKDDADRELAVINPPTLYKVLIPLVRAYCTVRVAALYNERNKSPLLPYRPLKKTARNRVIAEIITDMAETTATWYGYPSILDQAIKQMVKYGISISFPCEEWHCEEQILAGDEGEEEKVTVREGLRYLFPHPSRMFYDLYYPLTTLNSDSGVSHLFHWQVVPYSAILDERKYWNRNCIAFGTNWMDNPLAGNYFNEFYPCRLQFPAMMSDARLRENQAAFYTSAERDKAVFLSHGFMKIVPKDFGLGRYKDDKLVDTYDHPVWHHFIVAGDSTVIYAEPCAYNPSWMMGYDYDHQAAKQTSLALEAIPWQDHLGNIISQMFLTAKQNLANVIFYDVNMVSQTDIQKLKDSGEAKYRGMNFVPYDSMKFSKSQFDPHKAFTHVQLNYRSIQDMVQMMSSVLAIMERVLQFTAQEVGSTAKHYQSAEEIKETSESSDNRVNYTGASVDSGIDAWKKQLFEAMRAYRDDEVEAQVSSDISGVEQIIEDLGFKVIGRSKDKLQVKGSKAKLQYVECIKSGEGQENDTADVDPKSANILFQTIQVISKNPELFQAIGIKRILSIIEEGVKLAGGDSDFKLPMLEGQPGQPSPGQPHKPPVPGQPPAMPQPRRGRGAPPVPPGAAAPPGAPPPGAPPQPPPIQQQVTTLIQQAMAQMQQMVEQKIAIPAAQEMSKLQKEITGQGQALAKLSQIVQQIEALLAQAAKPPMPAPAGAPPAVLPPKTA